MFSEASGVKQANTCIGSNRDFPCPQFKRAPWENFFSLSDGRKSKVLRLWCIPWICVHTLRKKIKNMWALSDWQLMGTCQTFKNLLVSEAFLCVCVCPLISNRPCFLLWSIGISVFSWSNASPLPNLYSAPLHYFWYPGCCTWGGTDALLFDTWQVQVCLWSVKNH